MRMRSVSGCLRTTHGRRSAAACLSAATLVRTIRLVVEPAIAAALIMLGLRRHSLHGGHMCGPAKGLSRIQNPSSDESLQVITTLAPVETRLAENPPSPRPQINAERGKEAPARRRDLTAFIGEHDVPHGHKRIGNSDSDLASQVIVATSGETECIVVCRPRLTAG